MDFIHFKKFDSEYWIDLIESEKISNKDGIILSTILYYSIIFDYNSFSEDKLIYLLDIFRNKHDFSILKFFIASVLYKNTKLSYLDYIEYIPELKNITEYSLKKMIISAAINFDSKNTPIIKYIFDNKFKIETLKDASFYCHSNFRNFVDKTRYRNKLSYSKIMN
ncbi:MAG TPA: hypothetical protein PLQ81_08840 [bacterium]|nr:hypothetical protein [bacterium]